MGNFVWVGHVTSSENTKYLHETCCRIAALEIMCLEYPTKDSQFKRQRKEAQALRRILSLKFRAHEIAKALSVAYKKEANVEGGNLDYVSS